MIYQIYYTLVFSRIIRYFLDVIVPYSRKDLYGGKHFFFYFSSATASPLIATPEIRGGIVLDELVCFFALMSASLHRALSDAGGVNDHVNAQIAGMIAQQLTVQTTLNGVAQVLSTLL